MIQLVIVGGGKMGEALLRGLVAADWAPAGALAVVEPDAGRRAELADALPGVAVLDAPVGAQAALVAVKPQYVTEVCESLAGLGVKRILSIAAGVTIAAMEEAAGPGVAVIRAMPNTPALVGKGAAAIAPGSAAGDDDLAWAETVLGAVGAVSRVNEEQLDAVTGLSGSGPAYVFLMAEALIDAGVEQGLPRPLATELAIQTIAGAGELLGQGDATPAELRAAVTSPGGTTAAGLRALEAAATRAAFAAAVAAATQRSRELR